ncbi:MAG TPA: phosphoribosylformylglycinamidine synthase subunit PurL [Verrucomicrobiae bacterium]|nr:phosphoribosylformylglycinamidine synthase subunit PurL [Verrucomicrobiae bacterium]
MKPDIVITPELIARHGITPEEYERIENILGREPNITELGIFSVMWSEHCSYKNSRPELKKFPRDAPFILVKAGEENAGIVDIGDGWAIAFKIESHNHPSAVEPFQGAATGMGGIIRDIFTMGARPILGFNSLRFGPIEASDRKSVTGDRKRTNHRSPITNHQANKRLFAGVVAGIAHYGNCIGIPTVGGEVYFDESYTANPLVNALCLGILRHDQIKRGKAVGVGNPVIYVGSATGRDGLAGAAFASRELTRQSQADRPAVQVGDPFMEKLLLEACLEVMRQDGLVVGIQDMGAAGLTCSTCETASRGGTGNEIDLEKVPKRETGMTPYEIMLSESQERMLLVAQKGRDKEVKAIFNKWDLHGVAIGRVTGDGMMRVKVGKKIAAEIPAKQLAEDAPVYHRAAARPHWEIRNAKFEARKVPEPKNYEQVLVDLLGSPTIASKNWVYRQYDHMVQDGTVVGPGSDAAVIRINLNRPDLGPPVTGHQSPAAKYIGFTTDGNGAYCYLDPFEGGKAAVAEAVRNLVCSGARPLAITDCLNFGNPMRPEIFWQFRRCVEGISEACRIFGTPVTGGNVSFYNESPAGAVDPTPVIGMLGLIDDPKQITKQWFGMHEERGSARGKARSVERNAGDAILLLGELCEETPTLGLGGSEYLKRIHGLKTGKPPGVNLAAAKRISDFTLEIIRRGWVKSAHDCSEGGLAVALAECCISGSDLAAGARVDLSRCNGRLDALLFGETQSRIILSCAKENVGRIQNGSVPVTILGETGGSTLKIETSRGELSWRIRRLRDVWWNTIGRLMGN